MALVLNLKCVEHLKGKTDRLGKVTFRGLSYHTKIVQSAKRVAYFGETFEWPVARAVQEDEFIFISIINYSKYLSNKVIGTFNLSLQQVMQDGQLNVSEQLIDSHNRAAEELITFEVKYFSPDGKVGDWENQEFEYPLVEDLRPKDKREKYEDQAGYENSLLDDLKDEDLTGEMPKEHFGEDTESQTMLIKQMYDVKKKRPEQIEQELHKPRDFQICITIIEGMQFAGLDIDPVIRMEVGEEKKYTTIKQSSNNPFYNEYFVFDFCESPAMIFDKMITITALHAMKIPGRQVFKAGNLLAGRMIGQFKFDVGTVYSAPDHNYYHKWAVLLDPKDTSEGVKGYIKCDISVLGKGDVLRLPKHSAKEDESSSLEGNLLLPKGVPMDRQRATYQVTIYRAEDLPRTDLGIMASVRKAIGGTPVAMVDALVKVSFAGHVGKTSVKKNYHPEWREVLNFMDLFPPLCNRMKIQLCDSDLTSDDPIGTHFIELSQIMDPGGDTEGILPTYGPNWINFYGAPRNFKITAFHEDLNEGLGEGAAYRGRLLMALKTEIIDSEAAGPSTVHRDKLRATTRTDVAPRRQFLLFGTFFEVTMIDRELSDKPITFELSIGQFGNVLDAHATKSMMDSSSDESDSEEEESKLLKKKKEEETNLPCESTTPAKIPVAMDKNYYYLPYNENKPCTYVINMYEDLRKRLYHINMLEHLLDALEDGLEDVRQMLKNEEQSVHRRLRGVMSEFITGVDKYTRAAGGLGVGSGSGKSKLDKYRLKMCKTTMEKLRSQADSIKSKGNKDNVKEKYREAKEISKKLRHISKEPQHSLPDVFIWMISARNRVAYYRIPAKDLLDATDPMYKGKHCGKVQTLFLKKPGKKNQGSSGWVMQAKVEVCLWLGIKDAKKQYLDGIPDGYEMTTAMKRDPLPPTVLYYPEHHKFELRAFMYQARSLLGSDDTGLSDPFARILISNQCKQTEVIDATLSPSWDQTLVFKDIVLYGPVDKLVENPPVVIVEFFDYDTVGKPEFLGRAMIKPKVKSADVDYDLPQFPPQLQWWDVHRGTKEAGELLASFELLQTSEREDIPETPKLVPFKHNEKIMITPLPMAIKPTVSKHRMEVNFWGVRELRKIQLLKVDHPRVDLECAGQVLSSKRIEFMEKNCNFEDSIRYMDVDLPDNQNFWPPITIRVVDCRNFGRIVLVGVHTITHIHKYIRMPEEERNRIEEEVNKLLEIKANETTNNQQNITGNVTSPGDVTIVNIEGTNNNNNSITQVPDVTFQQPGINQNGQADHTTINMPPTNGNLPQPNSQPPNGTPGAQTAGQPNAQPMTGTNGQPPNGQPPTGQNGQPPNGQNGQSPNGPSGQPVTGPNGQPAVGPNGQPIMGPNGQPVVGPNGQPVMGPNGQPMMGPNGQPMMGPNGLPPGMSSPMDPAALERAEIKRKKKKDMVADLDWWSKYYVTKEDFDKAQQKEIKEKLKYQAVLSDSSEEELLAGEDFRDAYPDMLDYSSLDAKNLKELQELAEQKRKEEEDKMDKKSKKKLKKKKKSKFSKLKGKVNEAFEDSVDEADLEDDVVIQEDDMTDKSHISRFQDLELLVPEVKFVFYDCDLEHVKNFRGFLDKFETFDLFRGKKLDDDDEEDYGRISGKFKGNLCIYKIKEPEEDTISNNSVTLKKKAQKPHHVELKLSKGLPSFKPIELNVHVYIVKAVDLHPTDLNGKADPYLIIKCGRITVNDKQNKHSNQLNPVFGKLFEFEVTFPMDSLLHIQVLDYDLLSSDDLIGETTIDLENRLFSKHRGTCGLTSTYELYGYNIWRDTQKPSQIVERLCKQFAIEQPQYKATSVYIGGQTYYGEEKIELETGEMLPSTEHLALEVLKHWDELPGGCPLVPEHLESRTLHNPERPGVEQGRLELWVDLFPKDLPAPNITVDITPRLPKEYELRVIIWNTDDVVLEDKNFVTGEESSDIFVRGYLLGKGEDDQQTDVHYRSLTGEGNFNWRFIFPFQYLKAEEKVVHKKKMSIFDMDDTEIKVPPKVTLQVWDADLVSADDFLGSIALDLNRIPRPAKDAKKCKINLLKKDGTVPTLNLFKNKRCKGWWPMGAKDEEGARLVGKVEAELHLMTADEAEKSPAGLARTEPDPLPEPNRPDTSFLWFMNPLKTLKYILCRNYKWIILKVFLFLLLILFVALMIYRVPGATVDKMFHTG